MSTPYDVANIQMKKHVSAVPIVHRIDKFILPTLSARNPIVGRPIIIPRENIPVTTLPCCCDNPIVTAKSESEYMTLTYPNNITNPHNMTHTNPRFRSNDKSKDLYFALMIFIRSLRTNITIELTKNMQNELIRNAHARLMFSIIRFVQIEKRTPPAPEPAAQIPIARARRLLNH